MCQCHNCNAYCVLQVTQFTQLQEYEAQEKQLAIEMGFRDEASLVTQSSFTLMLDTTPNVLLKASFSCVFSNQGILHSERPDHSFT